MVMINVRTVSMVKPAQETPQHRLWCSNMDLVNARFHTLIVYFYRRHPEEGSCNFFDAEILKESLSKVLVPFYPVAGRLGLDNNGRLDINCNGEGVLFMEAESHMTLDDFGDFTPTVKLRKLVPDVDQHVDECDIPTYPLLILQVTRFQCGGVSLGVGIQHNLVDGVSCIHFINSWADVARGLGVTIPPFLDRTLLRARNPPAISFPHVEFQPPPSMILTPSDSSHLMTATDIFKLTKAQIDHLKSILTATTDHKISYSSYVTIAAHIWRCTCIARDLPPDQLTKMRCPTDGRKRLQPPLPEGYLGNVVFQAAPICAAGDLTLGMAAEVIRAALLRMDNEYLRSVLDYTETVPDLGKLVRGPHTFRCPNIGVISWTQMPIHDADFGWGKPVFMGPAEILFEGMAFVLPSPTGDGSVSVAISLQADHMVQFRELFYDFSSSNTARVSAVPIRLRASKL